MLTNRAILLTVLHCVGSVRKISFTHYIFGRITVVTNSNNNNNRELNHWKKIDATNECLFRCLDGKEENVE